MTEVLLFPLGNQITQASEMLSQNSNLGSFHFTTHNYNHCITWFQEAFEEIADKHPFPQLTRESVKRKF